MTANIFLALVFVRDARTPRGPDRLLAIVIRGCCENSAWIARGTTTKRAGNRSARVTFCLWLFKPFLSTKGSGASAFSADERLLRRDLPTGQDEQNLNLELIDGVGLYSDIA